MKLENMGFYFITDSIITKSGVINDVKTAVSQGVKIIQYREKNMSTREMFFECMEIKKICGKTALFLINDRIDLAMAVEADGVHLGMDDMPFYHARKLLGNDKIIGLTAHTQEEAIEAEQKGADYIGASPIFPTKTKTDAGKAAGTQLIREIKDNISIPVVAVGGINLENVDAVMDAGADSACAISAVIAKENPAEQFKKFVEIINRHRNVE